MDSDLLLLTDGHSSTMMLLYMRCLFLLIGIARAAVCENVTIIGGKEVKKPWMVSVQVYEQHVCGGTLINKQWVLTAAHCLIMVRRTEPKEPLTVLLGAHSLKKHQKSKRFEVQSYHIPKTFSTATKRDDLMLLKLKSKVKVWWKDVKTKGLPKSGKDVPAGTKCVISGWGATRANVKMPSDVLREVSVTVLKRELCNKYYERNPVITEDMLCAGNQQKDKDSCYGDSGGPLECTKHVVGLLSGGQGCGNPRKPGVFTLLSEKHLLWIKNILKTQSNSTAQ